MKTDRDILLISLFTFITVVSWITFELLKTVKTTTVTNTVQELVVPLTAELDTATLNILKSKRGTE